MKKGIRLFLIISTSLLLVSGVAYASFLISKIENNEGEVIDNTYTITLHYDDTTKVLSSLEEDSGFELPILTYEDKTFNGWSFEANSNTITSKDIRSVKDIKNLGGRFVKNAIDLYANVLDEVQVPEGKVLLKVTDGTPTNNLAPYSILTNAGTFSVFNIRYGYNNISGIIVLFRDSSGDEITDGRKRINETIDLTDYHEQILTVNVGYSPTQNN